MFSFAGLERGKRKFLSKTHNNGCHGLSVIGTYSLATLITTARRRRRVTACRMSTAPLHSLAFLPLLLLLSYHVFTACCDRGVLRLSDKRESVGQISQWLTD